MRIFKGSLEEYLNDHDDLKYTDLGNGCFRPSRVYPSEWKIRFQKKKDDIKHHEQISLKDPNQFERVVINYLFGHHYVLFETLYVPSRCGGVVAQKIKGNLYSVDPNNDPF